MHPRRIQEVYGNGNTGNLMLESQDRILTLTKPKPFDKQQLITQPTVRNLIGGCGLPLHITENTAFQEFLKDI